MAHPITCLERRLVLRSIQAEYESFRDAKSLPRQTLHFELVLESPHLKHAGLSLHADPAGQPSLAKRLSLCRIAFLFHSMRNRWKSKKSGLRSFDLKQMRELIHQRKDVPGDPPDEAIIEAISAMSKSLKITVVAVPTRKRPAAKWAWQVSRQAMAGMAGYAASASMRFLPACLATYRRLSAASISVRSSE